MTRATCPAIAEREGGIDTIIVSAEQDEALRTQQGEAVRATRKNAFKAEFGDRIAAQNAWLETHGVPGADLRPW